MRLRQGSAPELSAPKIT